MSRRRFAEVAAELGRRGLDEVELYRKRGRSLRLELGPQGPIEIRSREAGWAVRAGGRKGSLFACGTGDPEPRGPWPAAAGGRLQLPSVREAEAFAAGDEPPLWVEAEARQRLETFARELRRELPGARLEHAVVEDGASEAWLISSRGVDCSHCNRAASLVLSVSTGGERPVRRAHRVAARSAASIDFAALARRLAVLLTVARDGAAATGGDGEMVFAPAAAARLVAGLLPLVVGAGAWRAIRPFRDRGGRIGAEGLTLVDDGRLPGGPLAAPVDGEGVPTREVALVEGGLYRQPLLSWRETEPGEAVACGCTLRPSWRQPPEPAPSHLFVAPHPEVAPAELIGSVGRGFYWLEAPGPGRFDLDAGRFELPVCGFRLRRGKASEPVASARVTGSVRALLAGLRGVGRDLDFLPIGHLIGSPTLLVEGLALDG